MSGGMFLGLALIGVSAFHLVPALLTGRIPSKWPVYPLTREAKPVEYRITFGVFLIAGAVGLGLMLAGLTQIAGF